MPKRKRANIHPNEIVLPPAYPVAGHKLFERIGAAIGYSRGYMPSNVALARIMGCSSSTAGYWLCGSSQPHLVGFIALLEHIAPHERQRIVEDLCRDLPRLEHPCLGHDAAMVANLKTLLNQETGLTWISGANSRQRTFLLTALGHSFCGVDPRHRPPAGLDGHEPAWFVPVESLFYIQHSHQASRTLEAIRQVWPILRKSKSPLLLLNDIWSTAPELQEEIVAWASQRHVVVAEEKVPSIPPSALKTAQPIHLLKVSTSRKSPLWLVVDLERK